MSRAPRNLCLVGASALLATAVACTGEIATRNGAGPGDPGIGPAGPAQPGQPGGSNTPGTPGGSSTTPGTTPKPDEPGMTGEPPQTITGGRQCVSGKPGPRLLRRLSAEQLDNSVRDLFRSPAAPRSDVFNDPQVLGFSSDAAALLVRDLGSQQLMSYAEQVARWAVSTPAVAGAIAPCKEMTPACRGQFIKQFGMRAFRQPLSDAMAARYEQLFASAASFDAGLELTITAMLQSPYFLYRRELGQPDPSKPGLVRLTPFEVASNISYLITRSMPDDPLLQAAADNQLSTREQIDAQVERLLQDPKNRQTMHTFMSEWLESKRVSDVLKDPQIFDLSEAMRADMQRETAALVEDVVFTRKGSLADLLTANYTFVNASLAKHYGITGVTGTELVKANLPAERDPGILTQGSMMAGHAGITFSSPTLRGKLVRTRLLCENLPPPPDDVDTMIKVPAGAKTTREIFQVHSENAACQSCHLMMDQIGFGFERYDVVGRYRTTENGMPVDSSGTIRGQDFKFNGVRELVDYLNKSPEVRQCMVRFMAYSAYGAAAWNDDGCTYDAISKEAEASSWSIRSVLTAITRAPHFTTRVQ
jgi:hypothetical protein